MGVYNKYKALYSNDNYRSGLGFMTVGESVKCQSDNTMNDTWWNDPASQVAYLYDYYHDDNKTKLRNMDSKNDLKKVPIDIKFIVATHQSYDKDIVTRHIMMRPHQKCNVDYYEEMFVDTYSAMFPVGLYIDIADENGQYNRWIVARISDFYDPQFPKYDVLPCDYIFQWIYDGKKYNMAGTLRSQSSYNSGVWESYKVELPEDQQKFIVPMNKESENLWYTQRMIIDNKVKNPRCWKITKLNRLQSNGICLVTTAQDIFDPNRDYIERDEYGKIIGMWCEWFRQNQYAVDPQPVVPPSTLPDYYIKLIFGGTKPVLKVRGNYKKITATFLDKHENVVEDTFVDEWKVEIDGINVSEITDGEVSVVTHDDDDTLTANQIKIKTASDSLLGKVVSVTAIKGGLTDTKNFEIVGM